METYSLTELSAMVEQTLAPLSQRTYWVRCEIASCSSRSGHGYMELVENRDFGQLAAKMRATCWSNLYPMLCAYFEQETDQKLGIGMKVLLEVEITYHAVYGLSLNVVNIDPSYTIGDLAKQRMETIRRLQEEGVMEMQQTLTLPTLVRKLAIISAEQAAGYGDFVHQLEESGYAFTYQLFPAIMQGDKAEKSILQALNKVMEQEDEFDAVVIIRGGGATTDLGCFDSYLLAAACAQFPLPVLTGIGHTRDVSVLDMVAYSALKTPTAVAAFLVERLVRQEERLRLLLRRLREVGERQIMIRRHRLELLLQRLEACSPERIYRQGYSLLMADGKVVTQVNQVKKGQRLTTHLRDGVVESVCQ